MNAHATDKKSHHHAPAATAERFVVEGLGGKRLLEGSIPVYGAKNAVLKAIAAAALFSKELHIDNVPPTEDVAKMCAILEKAGFGVVQRHTDDPGRTMLTISVPSADAITTDIDSKLARSMRASVVLTGPMLARFGRVSFPAPGGCVIGARPVDLFIEAYEKLGATVRIEKDPLATSVGDTCYVIEAPQGGLVGAEIFFPIQTVGGTETLMMTAVLTRGTTVLKNCAMEPEIQSLAHFLVAAGADIQGIGTTTLTINGRGPDQPLASSARYVTMPDRIEAGSFAALAALSGKDIMVTHCNPLDLEAPLDQLARMGVSIERGSDWIRIASKGSDTAPVLLPLSIRTHEYPGFPTDLQSIFLTLMTAAAGQSTLFETIYEGRFRLAEELIKMGAHITIMNPRELLVQGPTPLSAPGEDGLVRAHDLRAGFAVLMAAIAAQGQTTIENVNHIYRGYARIVERLQGIGVKISEGKGNHQSGN